MGTDSSSQLIDGHVSVGQSKKAISALLKHVRKKQQEEDEKELLPGKEQHVWLVMTVKRMQPMKNLKPHKIPLAHTLVDPRTTAVCLITKDPQREYKDLLDSHNIKFISRVVGVQKLKGKFRGFDARRLLLRENGLFLADERVLPLLPGLLGKKWFEAKKQPIPVSLTKKDLKTELEKAISSTFMHQNRGTCTSIKVANLSHKDSQVLANIQAAIPAIVARIHGGWENVQSFNIKTSNSVSLPIWTCPLGNEEPGSRWAGMVADGGDEWTGFENNGSEGKSVPVGAALKVNGKKPAADAAGSAEITPKANSKKRVANAEGEVVVEGAKKKARKEKKSEALTVLTPTSAVEPEGKSTKKSSTKATPSKTGNITSTVPRTPLSAPPTAEASSKKPKKKRTAAEETPSSAPSSTLAEKAPTTKKLSSEQSLTRKELGKKKEALGDAKLERKKEKLRVTEKSARKGTKAQMVGRVKV